MLEKLGFTVDNVVARAEALRAGDADRADASRGRNQMTKTPCTGWPTQVRASGSTTSRVTWSTSGRAARLMDEDAVVGVTSNPTIFQKALAEGTRYDEQLRAPRREPTIRRRSSSSSRPTTSATRATCCARSGSERRAATATSRSRSIPTLAYDTEATFAEAERLHALIDRPNLHVKIPATKPGLPAIEDMIAAGKSINVTLIFSLQRYAEVAEAYIRGLERLVAAGGDPAACPSVASFFVSRVDTEADAARAIGSAADAELRGKLAVANAQARLRALQQELFAGERWEFLASKGASAQRCLWASTSTKNPAYPDVALRRRS